MGRVDGGCCPCGLAGGRGPGDRSVRAVQGPKWPLPARWGTPENRL